MPSLFVSNAGKVGVVANSSGLPAIIDIPGFTSAAVIVTSVGISQSSNVQIQPSLKNSIYVYSFGDNMGALHISGIAFIANMCGASSGDGFKDMVSFYSANRVSRSLKHVNVTIGSTVFSGFVISMESSMAGAENRFFNWVINIAALPNFDGMAASSGSSSSGTSPPSQSSPNANLNLDMNTLSGSVFSSVAPQVAQVANTPAASVIGPIRGFQ